MEPVTQFLVDHGYLILIAWVFLNQMGLPIPSIPYLLAAGALAGLGLLNPVLLVVLGVAAALPADLIWYEIGRRRGMGVLKTLCRVSLEPDSCVRETEGIFARYGARSLVFAKFIPAVETVAPPMAGLFGMRRRLFLVYDLLGTALWTATFVGLGYVFHEQVERIAIVVGRLGTGLAVLLGVVLVLYLGWKFVRRRQFLADLRIARITPEELRRRLESGEPIEVVDLRHSVEFEARPYTIPGARHIPVEALDARHHEIPRDRDLVLYCT